MSGFDLLLGQTYSYDVIKKSLSDFLGLSSVNTAVVVLTEVPTKPLAANTLLLVVSSKVTGNFKQLLQFYPQDACGNSVNPLELAKYLSNELSDRCLVSDSNNNPYTSFLIEESMVFKVALDVDALDNEGRCEVSKIL